jgi:hypothetical protein
MSVKDLDASAATGNFDLAMQLVLQLPHDARRSNDVISIMRRLVEQKYDEKEIPPGVHFLNDLRIVGN